MALQSLGRIRVNPGSPTRVTFNQSAQAAHLACGSIMIQAWSTNSNLVWIGNSDSFDKTTGVGVLAILAVPTSNSIPAFSAGNPTAQAGINANEVYIDGTSSNDYVIASIVR